MSSSDSDSDSDSNSEVDLTQNSTEDNNSEIDLTEEDNSSTVDLTQHGSSDTELGSEDVRITINPGNLDINNDIDPQLIRTNARRIYSPRPDPHWSRIPLPPSIDDGQDTTTNNPSRWSIYPYRNSIPVPEPIEEKEITNPIYIECIACKERMINTICYPCQHAILCCECARAWGQLQNICPLCKVGIVSIERIYFHYREYQLSPSSPLPPLQSLSPPAPTECSRCNKRAKRILKRIYKNHDEQEYFLAD